jgi:murein DD-endopeptidase MepM/ murein hydrolase activator NlpD
MAQENKELITRLKNKYRLSIRNEKSFEEVWFIRLSRLNIMSLVGAIFVVLVVSLYLLIAYTSIRELIPGYPDGDMRRAIIMNAIKVDSLEREIQVRDQYIRNINSIVAGEEPEDYAQQQGNIKPNTEKIIFTKSAEDSILRSQIEQEEQFNLTLREKPVKNSFASLHFFAPVKGIITSSFNPEENHYGTDIAAGNNAVIKAVLPGTVIEATWTLETGYIIQLQHENNLVSFYKHNSELLKTVGNKVAAGEAIAIMGNSGELTSGPHLHFELWHDGVPINAEDYIIF